jgi:hypothetical protein
VNGWTPCHFICVYHSPAVPKLLITAPPPRQLLPRRLNGRGASQTPISVNRATRSFSTGEGNSPAQRVHLRRDYCGSTIAFTWQYLHPRTSLISYYASPPILFHSLSPNTTLHPTQLLGQTTISTCESRYSPMRHLSALRSNQVRRKWKTGETKSHHRSSPSMITRYIDCLQNIPCVTGTFAR